MSIPGQAPISVAIDILVEAGEWPDESALGVLAEQAVASVVAELGKGGEGSPELSLVFTEDAGIAKLNAEWRGKEGPTNVLSFPAFPVAPGAALPPMLGDIVLAAETVSRESKLDGKPLEHHIAHLIIHGFLHLVGHDHETETEAEVMESIERRALARLAIPDPYA